MAEHESEPSSPPPPIVLIVGDDRDTRDLYEAVFELEGFWVADASDAEAAFQQASDLQPDVVITDVGLPGRIDGVDLATRIHAMAKTASVPVIAITGRNPEEIALSEFTEVLQKPVSPNLLIAAARRVLAESAALRDRGDQARKGIPELRERSNRLTERSQYLRERPDRRQP